MTLEITLTSVSIPGEGLADTEGSDTQIQVMCPERYQKLFPDLVATQPLPQRKVSAVVVVRQQVQGKYVETSHFVTPGPGDILLKGLVGADGGP